jgi:hypothetical protein
MFRRFTFVLVVVIVSAVSVALRSDIADTAVSSAQGPIAWSPENETPKQRIEVKNSAVFTPAGANKPEVDDHCYYYGDTQHHFEKAIKAFTKGIVGSTTMRLYEGFPHQLRERDLFVAELKRIKSVTIKSFPFYVSPLAVAVADQKRLQYLLERDTSFQRYIGIKACWGFHPDWVIECSTSVSSYQIFLCFGCHEARLYGPSGVLYADLAPESHEQFVTILQSYRKNRPKKEAVP